MPTRDRLTALSACLEALARQDRPVDVIVVDDGSVDGAAVEALVRAAPRARLVRRDGHGPAAARNAGVAAATADVVCFTDDDCRPDPGWARAIVDAVAEGAAVVAGPTVVGASGDHVAAAAQLVTNHLVEESLDAEAGTVGFAPTSNLGGLRRVFETLAFDEAYPAAAGEDRDWCARLAASGRTITWAPGAVVGHHPDLTLRGFWRQQERYGRGARRVHSSGAGGRAEAGFYLRLLRRGWRAGWREGALVGLAQVATLVGYARARARRPS
ncbi:MAG: glycosyltransferase family 2 protein [Acidimicrobiia bacterium]